VTATEVGVVQGAGLAIAWRQWGRDSGALPLVLLHGVTGSGADWAPMAEALAPRRRVLAFDARGHGASDWSADIEYTGDSHFADVLCALEALGIGECALAGYSMGGSVAIMAAAAGPEVVRRLAVIDSYPAPEMTPGSRRIAAVIATAYGGEGWSPAGARPPFDPAIARKMAANLAAGDDRRLDLWPLWDALECPTLIVRGEWSDVLPAALAGQMCLRNRHASMATIQGVAHQVPFVRPRETAALLARFLDGA
jgi:pimeloyl-ACP methyl ester carboxylesterase